MIETPHFSVRAGTSALAATSVDGGGIVVAMDSIPEGDRVHFCLDLPEPGQEYQVRIGNLPPDAPHGLESGRDPAMGIDIGHQVFWPASTYLDSARGPTVIELRSRSTTTDETWRTRARLELTVRPGKLGEARYRAMFNELRALSAGLVFDLVSKSSRAYRFIHSPEQIHTGSRQIELRAIEQTWRALVPLLHQIAELPATRLVRQTEMRRCWGGERLHASAARYLAVRGVDARSTNAVRPYTAPVERLAETHDTSEHAVIAGFLDLLRSRLNGCRRSAAAQLATLEARLGSINGTRYGWARIEQPRMERLREAIATAERLDRQIHRVRRWPILKSLTPALHPLRTPVFDNIAAYSRVRREILGFMHRPVSYLMRVRATSSSRPGACMNSGS